MAYTVLTKSNVSITPCSQNQMLALVAKHYSSNRPSSMTPNYVKVT